MHVCVSGASGFTGGHVCAALLARGHAVTALARPASDTSRLSRLAPDAAIIRAGESDDLAAVLADAKPDAICHLAALFRANIAPAHVAEMIDANITFGTQLVEAARAGGCRRVVTAGSYWQNAEGRANKPNSLYAATKTAFREICAYYAHMHDLICVELRLFDSYGPDDRRGKLLSLLDAAVARDVPLDMTAGEQVLYPVYVTDVASAFVHAVESGRALLGHGANGGVVSYAVPGPEALTLRQMVEIYADVRRVAPPINWGARPYPPGQVMQPYLGDQLPAWSARLRFAEGLRMVYGEGASTPSS